MVILVGNHNFAIKNISEMKDAAHIELMIPSTKFFFLRNKIYISGLNYLF